MNDFANYLNLATHAGPNSFAVKCCSDRIQDGRVSVGEAIRQITEKLKNADFRIVLHALFALEEWAKVTHLEFRRQIADEEFMSIFRTNLANNASPKVRTKARELLRRWATSWGSQPEFRIIVETSNSLSHCAPPSVIKKETVKEQTNNNPIDEPLSALSIEEMSDQCSCIICSETFDSEKVIPRYLDCGHTFCEICIYNDRIRVNRSVKCPICPRVTALPDGKVLPINYFAIGIVERLMQTRIEPKFACKSCDMKFPPESVRICIEERCGMFNQIICVSCALDEGHGGHVVKYDMRMKKVRDDTRAEVTKLSSKIEAKKERILRKIDQLVNVAQSLKPRVAKTIIPRHVIDQIDTLFSEQEAAKYMETVNYRANALLNGFDSLEESFDYALDTANPA